MRFSRETTFAKANNQMSIDFFLLISEKQKMKENETKKIYDISTQLTIGYPKDNDGYRRVTITVTRDDCIAYPLIDINYPLIGINYLSILSLHFLPIHNF